MIVSDLVLELLAAAKLVAAEDGSTPGKKALYEVLLKIEPPKEAKERVVVQPKSLEEQYELILRLGLTTEDYVVKKNQYIHKSVA